MVTASQCVFYEKNDDIALYPFLKNSVNNLGYELDKEYFDFQGAYTYNPKFNRKRLNDFFDNIGLQLVHAKHLIV